MYIAGSFIEVRLARIRMSHVNADGGTIRICETFTSTPQRHRPASGRYAS